MKPEITVVLNNIRSAHNVGAILRTAEGFGIEKIIVVGVTPYPELKDDQRLPHIKIKLSKQINKTALGAEDNLRIQHFEQLKDSVLSLRDLGYEIVFIEQAESSVSLDRFKPKSERIAIVFGTEVTGFTPEELTLSDQIIEIPMFGKKESFNVSVSAGIVLYQIAQNN
jgi:23S rRNA (guanosine2251-2'-O)-methyltransferase